MACSFRIRFQHVGAEDVGGHQIGRELHAGEAQAQGGGKGTHKHGLAQPGQSFEQEVSVGKEGDERVAYYLPLAHDDLPHGGFDSQGQLPKSAGGEISIHHLTLSPEH